MQLNGQILEKLCSGLILPKDPFVPLQMQWMVTKMVRWDGHNTSLVCRARSWKGQLHQSQKGEGDGGRWANGRKMGISCQIQ